MCNTIDIIHTSFPYNSIMIIQMYSASCKIYHGVLHVYVHAIIYVCFQSQHDRTEHPTTSTSMVPMAPVPLLTEALERVYHACVMVAGFPCTTCWTVVAALFAFILTWFVLPGLSLASVAARMLLPLLRLPMTLFTQVIAPCLEVRIQSVVKAMARSRDL